MTHVQVPLAEVQVGDQLAHIVRIQSVKLVQGKSKAYLSVSLSDKSGLFKAIKWGEGRGDATEEERKHYESIPVALVTGQCDEYNNNKSFKLTSIAAIGEDFSTEDINAIVGDVNAAPPAQESNTPKSLGGGSWSFKTKAEIGFDTLVKTQKPLRDCQENDIIKHVFRVCSITAGKTSKGLSFIEFHLGDALSSPMKARLWRVPENALDALKGTKVIYIEGVMEVYTPQNSQQGILQIKFNNDAVVAVSDATEADVNMLVMSSPYPIKALANGIWGFVQSFQDQHLKQLCESLLKDPKNKDFRFAPAGVTYHHSWRSGLCEHTYRLMQLVDDFVSVYNTTELSTNKLVLNRDMILAGALYHDFFKCFEYTTECSYAPEGNLLKHLSRGVVDIGARTLAIPQFPETTKMVLAHCIGAHHGKKEWDAIELPGCPEALIVHWFDNLCSKVDPTITELNLLKEGVSYSTNKLKPLNSVPYIGGCKREKPLAFTPVAVSGQKGHLSAIKQMLTRLRDSHLKELCLRILERNNSIYATTISFGQYRGGLLEYIYRTMHFVGNFVNSYNDKGWPGNQIYIDSDAPVAGAFLQNAYRFKDGDPLLENIGSCLFAIGEVTSQIDGFPDELRNLMCQIVASQGENAPEIAICPDSIINQYYLPLIYKLDTINILLSKEGGPVVSEEFGKTVILGTCKLSAE